MSDANRRVQLGVTCQLGDIDAPFFFCGAHVFYGASKPSFGAPSPVVTHPASPRLNLYEDACWELKQRLGEPSCGTLLL